MKFKQLVLCLFLLLGITGCKKDTKQITDKEELKIFVASDLHFIAPQNYKDCSWASEAFKQGDGKMVDSSDVILDQFIKEINEQNPDLVIITGDITLNGDEISHHELAKYLELVKTQIVLMPGNHDLDNYLSLGYKEEGSYAIPSIHSEDFREIYHAFGYDQAITKDEASCSYRININDDYALILLDDSGSLLTGHVFDDGGFLTEKTYEYLENELKAIQEEKRMPIIAMHHNLAIHNESHYEQFTIHDNEKIAKLMKQYGVQFVFSGHMHLQHIASVEGVYDIASSSLLVNPLQYGILTLDQDHMDYQTKALDLDLNSFDYYVEVFKNRMGKRLEEDLDEDVIELLGKANAYYFAGISNQLLDDIKDDPAYKKLSDYNHNNDWATYYIQSVLNENTDSCHLTIQFNK